MIKFGTAGNDERFYEEGYKKSEQIPEYLSKKGLDAYEYQCSRGVRISDEKAELLKQEAEKYNISLSVHSPYYISLSTQDEEKKKSHKTMIRVGSTVLVLSAIVTLLNPKFSSNLIQKLKTKLDI